MKRIIAGAIVMLASEIGMLLHVEPFWSWQTPIAWTGYIVCVDGIVHLRRGTSWLSDAPAEFAFLAVVSFPLWLVFEFYNLFIRNWHYINLPASAFWRDVGYVWAFATIWPAIFETGDLVAGFRGRRSPAEGASRVTTEQVAQGSSASNSRPESSAWAIASIVAGAAMLLWPLLFPSRYLAAPVWLGFIFLLDPLNALAGRQSLIRDWRDGRVDRTVNLAVAGLICGFVWEFWNFWARAKWIYSVPILERFKLFEMPAPGYLGFPAFALECFTMYVFLRLLLRLGPGRPIAL